MAETTHRVPIVRVTDIQKHPNADTLSIIKIGGYQCVVKTDDFKEGDLAVYIQPDSVVPERPEFAFLWKPRIFDGSVPEKYRRVTVRRYRKEWSEGLLLPISDVIIISQAYVGEGLGSYQIDPLTLDEGTDVANILGITHYNPPEPEQNTRGDNEPSPESRQNKIWPRSLKGWGYFLLHLLGYQKNTAGWNEKAPHQFRPIYDVEAYKNFADAFESGEEVIVTEKIHGSNARYTFVGGHMYAGSRQLWKSPKSNCIWRKVLKQHPWIEQWCRIHPNFTLYAEVVPTQTLKYGCKNDETKIFIFDILTPEGKWASFDGAEWKWLFSCMGGWNTPQVPILYRGPFNKNTILSFVDGLSKVSGANHLKEGIVIRPVKEREIRNLGRLQLKIVSNQWLEKDK